MSEPVKRFRLKKFLSIAEKRGINFAEITYQCGAHKFIDTNHNYTNNGIKIVRRFKREYLEEQEYSESRYFVLAIVGKSYVMYEVLESKILIWVSYTHDSFRRNGYITRILRHLTELYQSRSVIGHTHNKSLLEILKSLGIIILKNE